MRSRSAHPKARSFAALWAFLAGAKNQKLIPKSLLTSKICMILCPTIASNMIDIDFRLRIRDVRLDF